MLLRVFVDVKRVLLKTMALDLPLVSKLSSQWKYPTPRYSFGLQQTHPSFPSSCLHAHNLSTYHFLLLFRYLWTDLHTRSKTKHDLIMLGILLQRFGCILVPLISLLLFVGRAENFRSFGLRIGPYVTEYTVGKLPDV